MDFIRLASPGRPWKSVDIFLVAGGLTGALFLPATSALFITLLVVAFLWLKFSRNNYIIVTNTRLIAIGEYCSVFNLNAIEEAVAINDYALALELKSRTVVLAIWNYIPLIRRQRSLIVKLEHREETERLLWTLRRGDVEL